MAVTGILTAAVGYPILHECGHLAAALLAGIAIRDVRMITEYAVTLDLGQGEASRAVWVAVSGGWFPLLALLIPHRRFFAVYLMKIAIATAGLCCAAASLVQVFLYRNGGLISPFDDVGSLMEHVPRESVTVFLALVIQAATAAGYLCRTRPVERIVRYLE